MSQGGVRFKEVAGHPEEVGPHPEDNGQSLMLQAKECQNLTWVLQQAFWLSCERYSKQLEHFHNPGKG